MRVYFVEPLPFLESYGQGPFLESLSRFSFGMCLNGSQKEVTCRGPRFYSPNGITKLCQNPPHGAWTSEALGRAIKVFSLRSSLIWTMRHLPGLQEGPREGDPTAINRMNEAAKQKSCPSTYLTTSPSTCTGFSGKGGEQPQKASFAH